MYTKRADFVFTVSRDFVRSIRTPLLIAPDARKLASCRQVKAGQAQSDPKHESSIALRGE